MTWNYRVFRKRTRIKQMNPLEPDHYEDSYHIHSVHYNKNGEICDTSADPMAAHGYTEKDLLGDLNMMTKAFEKSPLNWEDYQQASDFAPMDHELEEDK